MSKRPARVLTPRALELIRMFEEDMKESPSPQKKKGKVLSPKKMSLEISGLSWYTLRDLSRLEDKGNNPVIITGLGKLGTLHWVVPYAQLKSFLIEYASMVLDKFREGGQYEVFVKDIVENDEIYTEFIEFFLECMGYLIDLTIRDVYKNIIPLASLECVTRACMLIAIKYEGFGDFIFDHAPIMRYLNNIPSELGLEICDSPREMLKLELALAKATGWKGCRS